VKAFEKDMRFKQKLNKLLLDRNFNLSEPGLEPRPDKITVVVIPRDEPNKRPKQNLGRKPSEDSRLVKPWQTALKASKIFPRRSTAAERRMQRRLVNPSMHFYLAPPEAPKHCVECLGTTTSKNLKGAENWYRLEVPIGPVGYLDNNCYRKRERRVKREAKGKG
jgi:hypothetical protein